MDAMDFLVNVQKRLFGENYNPDLDIKGKNVIVIGGGDTAMDCVRVAIREGAKKVICAYRRDLKSMPGSKREYQNALEEGGEFVFNASPKEILLDENKNVIGVKFIKTISTVKDGKKRLEEIKGSEFKIAAQRVIFALGFDNTPLEFLSKNGIKVDKWGAIVVDKNYETTKKGGFAGGDCYRGADLVVTAALDGREAAKNIIKRLLD
jgi:glutamate synthase (NADPH/NADH) small chain